MSPAPRAPGARPAPKAAKPAKAADFRVCPACETRNRAKYEFCVKCGESLQDVPLGEPAPATAAATVGEAVDTGPDFSFTGILLTIVAIGAAVGLFYFLREPPTRPPAEAFSVGTLPPSMPPPAPPAVKSPAEELYRQGMTRMTRGDNAGAEPFFAQAIAAAPEEARYRHARALALWGSNRQRESIGEYEEAIRLAPEAAHYRLNYAKALATVGRKEDAAREMEEVLARQPGDTDTQHELARLLADRQPQRALELYRSAAEQQGSNMIIKQEYAALLQKTGDADGAMAVYADIVKRQSDAHISRGLYAELLYSRGQAEEAVNVFREGLERHPNAPLLHRGLGSVLERSGRMTEAAAAYREYARLAPNAADAQKLRERADRLEKEASPAPS